MTNIALDIDKYQFLELSKDWLELRNLCFLDTALCNQRLRSLFISSLLNNIESAFYFCPAKHYINSDFVGWIFKRNLRLNSIHLNNSILMLSESLSGQESLDYVSRTVRKVQLSGLADSMVGHASLFLNSARHLEEIILLNSGFMTSGTIQTIAERCPRLTSYDISGAPLYTGGLFQLSTLHASKVILNDIECGSLSDDELRDGLRAVVINNSKHLHTLEIANPDRRITCELYVKSIATCSSLTVLNMAHSYTLTLESFQHIANNSTHITDLNLEYCTMLLNNDLLDCLIESSLLLRRLYINNGPDSSNLVEKRICDNGIRDLVKKCTTITDINISSNHLLTLLSVKSIVENLELKKIQFKRLPLMNCFEAMKLFCASFLSLSRFDMCNMCLIGSPKKDKYGFDDAFVGESRAIRKILKWCCLDVSYISLNFMELRYCCIISEIFASKFNNLTVLILSNVSSDDQCLNAVSVNCVHLTSVSLHFCSLFTDTGVLTLLQSNRQVVCLSCILCPLLSDKTLEWLCEYKKLQELTFESCNATYECFEKLVRSSPKLTSICCTFKGSYRFEDHNASIFISLGRVLGRVECRHERAIIDLTRLGSTYW
jgi:hypothetical protein